MKTMLVIILMAVAGCAFPYSSAHAGEISRSDILDTVRHMQELAGQQKQALLQAQQDFKDQAQQIKDDRLEIERQKARADQKEAACAQAEKERDSLIWIFSLACGMAALGAFRQALQVIQMPWQLLALAGVFVGGFAVGFTIGRWALRFLAQFTPHLPF